MQAWTVRRAVVDDLDSILEIDSVHSDQRSEQLQGLTRGVGGFLLVAEGGSDSSLVGYLALSQRHFFGRDFIELLVTREDDRRQGVGTLLLAAALGAATTRTVFTSANESNTAMRALLTRENWTVSGALEGLDEGDPEVVYFRRR